MSSRFAIFSFTARRCFSTAVIWGSIFTLYTAACTLGFASAYPTVKARAQLVLTLGSNSALKVFYGVPHQIGTAAGFTQWRGIGILSLMAAVLGFTLAVKYLRGEEEKGRLEELLSGQSGLAWATVQNMLGVSAALAIAALIPTIALFFIGRKSDIHIGASSALLYGLCLMITALVFAGVGSLFSQFWPDAKRANLFSIGIFGISFLARAAADSTNYRWLRDFTPLGWIEQVQPLLAHKPINFIPAAAAIALLAGLAIFISSRRDLGFGVFQERMTSAPKTRLLGSQFGLSLRLMLASLAGWVIVSGLAGAIYGALTKTAADAFASALRPLLGHSGSTQQGALIFLGLIFMIFTLALMIMVAVFMTSVREEEATGHLDTLIVEPVSRTAWLGGRIFLIVAGVLLSGACIGPTTWLALKAQNLNLAFSKMFLAGINSTVPALFLLGIGILVFAILPRYLSIAVYAVITSSFLIQMLASIIKSRKWLLDLSIFHHVALAPQASPNWQNNATIIALALVGAVAGLYVFNKRDIALD